MAAMESAEDSELVRRMAERGEAGARAEVELCRRYAPRIRLYGLKHLRNEESARDLVQTVLIGVLQAARAQRIDDAARLDRFVLGTCRHAAARMRQREGRVELVSDEELVRVAVPEPETLDVSRLMRCVGELEERAQKVVLMSFQEERSSDEIAALLSLSAGNVRVVRHRALSALRRCLDAREGSRS
jgi:RNA polymerase sigma-70 factor, ECF subfamily